MAIAGAWLLWVVYCIDGCCAVVVSTAMVIISDGSLVDVICCVVGCCKDGVLCVDMSSVVIVVVSVTLNGIV